ncbi:Cytidylate kinase-like family [Syntrophobacter sp. SbD1]|nr:Cytidylate kinase-like family [Syntrophobacter sp. SbD1]
MNIVQGPFDPFDRSPGKMTHPIVITVGRELGSGGSYVAQRVAKRLGYAYIDRQILQQAAAELGLEEIEVEDRDERLQTFWERLISVFSLGGVDSVYIPPPRWVTDEELIETERRFICELAGRGPCVVLGHAAFHLLRGRARLLNVYIHAPVSFRIQRVKSIYGAKSDREAAGMIDRSDHERNRYIRFFTELERSDFRNYHLTIDTGLIDFDTAEEMIASLAGSLREEGDWPWVNQPC